jgi:hypothetical protein
MGLMSRGAGRESDGEWFSIAMDWGLAMALVQYRGRYGIAGGPSGACIQLSDNDSLNRLHH